MAMMPLEDAVTFVQIRKEHANMLYIDVYIYSSDHSINK